MTTRFSSSAGGRRARRVSFLFGSWTVCSVLLAAPASAEGTTTRVSVGAGGVQGSNSSSGAAISADGRFVAFQSLASNLVVGDTNGATDVFVYDRHTATTTRVSVGVGGVQGNSSSSGAAISADGRFVAFASSASNLVVGDTNTTQDVFVHDRQTGTTTRVSVGAGGVQANASCSGAAISADGQFVAFASFASNLVVGDTNGATDVFVYDRQTATTTRVSVGVGGVQGNEYSAGAAISADGRFVAFQSPASNLVVGDTNTALDVFVHDRQTGTTTRVSVGAGGVQGNEYSAGAAISADGRFVAFYSFASNLLVGDTNAADDVFVHDRQTGTTTRVSVGAGGVQGNGISSSAAISADGRFVAFYSDATNLVSGDTNGTSDAFVHDRQTGTTTRVSVGAGGVQGNNSSSGAAISADGRFVAFDSSASNLVVGDTNGHDDVFVHDRQGRAVLPAGDYDGDGRADVAVYRPSTGGWYIVYSSTGTAVAIAWGTAGDIPAPADYDGDGRTDVAVYRPSTGVWWIIQSAGWTSVGVRWGTPGDVPVPADYDGDGRADVAVYRPATGIWYILRSSTGLGVGMAWGTTGDIPVPADYDGDGRTDVAVYRPSTGVWWIIQSAGWTSVGVRWGTLGDLPVPADYDGDGRADPTVFRPSNGVWYQLRSTTGVGSAVHWGTLGDVPVAGDYDGDGYADPTVFRPSTGTWYELRTLTGTCLNVRWGTAGDLPQ